MSQVEKDIALFEEHKHIYVGRKIAPDQDEKIQSISKIVRRMYEKPNYQTFSHDSCPTETQKGKPTFSSPTSCNYTTWSRPSAARL